MPFHMIMLSNLNICNNYTFHLFHSTLPCVICEINNIYPVGDVGTYTLGTNIRYNLSKLGT